MERSQKNFAGHIVFDGITSWNCICPWSRKDDYRQWKLNVFRGGLTNVPAKKNHCWVADNVLVEQICRRTIVFKIPINTWKYYLQTIFQFQRGFSPFRLQSARPARLSHKPTSNQPPHLSREHHLDILQVQWIVQTAESNWLHEHQLWPFTRVALVAMAADFNSEVMQTEQQYLHDVIVAGITGWIALKR